MKQKTRKEKKKPTSKQYKSTGYMILFISIVAGMQGGGFWAAIIGASIATPFLIKANKLAKTE